MYCFEKEVDAILSLDGSSVKMVMGVLDEQGNQLAITYPIFSLYHWCVANRVWALQDVALNASFLGITHGNTDLNGLHEKLDDLVQSLPEGTLLSTLSHCPSHMLKVYFRELAVYYDDHNIPTFRNLQKKISESPDRTEEVRKFLAAKAEVTGNSSFALATEIIADSLLQVLREV